MNLSKLAKRELIDTQWDVNKLPKLPRVTVGFGINRYIVGCKFIAYISQDVVLP